MSDGAFTWMSDADKARANREINDTLRDAGLEHDAPKARCTPILFDPDAERMAAEIALIQRIAHIRYGGEWTAPVRDPKRYAIHIARCSDGASVTIEQTPFGENPLGWPDEPTYPPIGLKP